MKDTFTTKNPKKMKETVTTNNPRTYCLKTGTINVNGMNERTLKYFNVINEIEKAKLDICAIQETLIITPEGLRTNTVGNYDIYLSGYKRAPKKRKKDENNGESCHNCGVGIAVRKNKNMYLWFRYYDFT